MRLKKAQIKTMESVLVMVIFFIILVIGMIFYVKISKIQGSRTVSERQELKAIGIAEKIKTMPELLCTQKESQEYDCVDYYKAQAFSQIFESSTDPNTRNYYYSLLSRTNINVTQVFPLYNSFSLYHMVDVENETSGPFVFFLPVTVFDAIERTYNFGYVRIEVFS